MNNNFSKDAKEILRQKGIDAENLKNIDKNSLLKNLSSEVSDFKIKTQTDYETFESNLRNSTKYYETAFSG